MYAVILCGGSGSRLWPLSRENHPKQFLNLYSKNSLLQETFLRAQKVIPAQNIFLVIGKENSYIASRQIKEINSSFSEEQIIIEPIGLGTFPATILAVKYLTSKKKIDPNKTIALLSADHYIADTKKFQETLLAAMENSQNNFGAIGIKPTRPETGYGYIRKGEKRDLFFKALEFKEKPDYSTATSYLASGEYVWNSGMYVFSPKTFFSELKKHSPQSFSLATQSFDFLSNNFSSLPATSLDYAISEKSNKLIIFEGDFDWSDVGSFDALCELEQKDNSKQININSKNNYTLSSSDKLFAFVGISDTIVIETEDSILIQKKGCSQCIKEIVKKLKKKGDKEIKYNLTEYRPWGKFEVLSQKDNHQIKRLTLYPKARISLQLHHHRLEHWTVVKGLAKVTLDEKEIYLKENEHIVIPQLAKHRLENPGKINLEIIETQTGNYLGEDDIVRFKDDYNRI